jgi:hypothetical protein
MNYELMGGDVIISARDRDRILYDLQDTYKYHGNLDQWIIYYATLMPLYLEATLKKKMPPFIPGTDDGYAMINYLRDRSGYPGGRVVAFLTSVYTLAKNGTIQQNVANPAISDAVAENKPKTMVDKAIDDAIKAASAGVKNYMYSLMYVGGAVLLIYLLAKTVLTGGVKLPSFRKS